MNLHVHHHEKLTRVPGDGRILDNQTRHTLDTAHCGGIRENPRTRSDNGQYRTKTTENFFLPDRKLNRMSVHYNLPCVAVILSTCELPVQRS